VLVEQLGTIDAQRLGKWIGHLAPEELWSVDQAHTTVLGLSRRERAGGTRLGLRAPIARPH